MTNGSLNDLSHAELQELRSDYVGVKCGEDIVRLCDELLRRRTQPSEIPNIRQGIKNHVMTLYLEDSEKLADAIMEYVRPYLRTTELKGLERQAKLNQIKDDKK